MKNNTIFTKTLLACAAALFSSAFMACDDIAEDNRYHEVEAVAAQRAVLIEDFTGQNCINCPDAHEVIEALEEQYGDNVIAVSIHGGGMSLPLSWTNFEQNRVGLATEEGNYYNSIHSFSSWPAGVINGYIEALDYKTWASYIRPELERPAELSINLSAALSTDGDQIAVNVELLPQKDMTGQLYVWILEDGIEAIQKTSAGMVSDYVHNNVFRAPVNDVDGEAFQLEESIHKPVRYTIAVRDNEKEKWVPENMKVVAFLKTANGVENVAKAKVQVD